MAKLGKAEKRAARGQRLAAALRENLKRRKAQARSRAAGSEPADNSTKSREDKAAGTPDFRRNPGSE